MIAYYWPKLAIAGVLDLVLVGAGAVGLFWLGHKLYKKYRPRR